MKKYKHLTGIFLLIFVGFLVYANSLGNHFQFDDHRMIDSIKSVPRIRNLFSLRPTSRMITQISFYLNYHYRLSRANIIEFHLVNIFAHILTGILVYWIVFLLLKSDYTDERPDYTDKEPDYSDPPSSRSSSGLRRAGKTMDSADKNADDSEFPIPQSPFPNPPAFAKASAGRHYPSPVPLFTALLFLVHPLCTETVNYIIARYSLLATMFSFLSLFFFILYLRSWTVRERLLKNSVIGVVSHPDIVEVRDDLDYQIETEGRPINRATTKPEGSTINRTATKKIYLLGTVLSFLLAGYSKEVGFYYSLVAILLYLLVFSARGHFSLRARKELIFTFFLLIAGALFFWNYLGMPEKISSFGLSKSLRYFLTENKIFFAYLKLLIFPFVGLTVDHHQVWTEKIFDFFSLSTLCLNLIFFGGALFLVKKNKILSFVILCIYFFLLPFFFVVSEELMVEYRVYPAIFAYVLILAYGLDRFLLARKPKLIVFSGIIIAFSLTTIFRNTIWRDPITLWTDAVKKAPNKARTHANLGTAYLSFGLYDQAIEELHQAINLGVPVVEPYVNLATVYVRKGEYDLAIEQYKIALEIETKDTNKRTKIYLNLGSSYAEKGEYDKAREAYEKALLLSPYSADIYYNLGLLAYQEKDYHKAVENFRKAIELNPNYAAVYNSLGIVYDLQGQYELAIASYEKAIANSHYFPEAYYNLGISYQNLGKFEKAVEMYQEALKINPHYAKAYNNLGNIYYKKGKYEEAIGNYKKAISFAPDLVEGYNNLGTVYLEKKMYNEAEEIFKKILEIDPKNKEAKKNLQQTLEKISSK